MRIAKHLECAVISSAFLEGQFILGGGCARPCQNLTGGGLLEHFPAKWEPVRGRKCDH